MTYQSITGSEFKPRQGGYDSPTRKPYSVGSLVIPNEFQFRAETRDLYAPSCEEDGDAIKIPKRKALFVEGTDQYLGQHSDRYHHVDHLDALDKAFDMIDKSNLDKTGMEVYFPGGLEFGSSNMHCSIIFPAESFDMGDSMEKHSFRYDLFNSYSGMFALRGRAGPWRRWCDNGCYHIDAIAQYWHKHTKGISVTAMQKKLDVGIEKFRDSPDLFQRLRDTTLSNLVAQDLLKKTIARSNNPKNPSDYNRALLDRIGNAYDSRLIVGAPETKISAWDLYQSVTAWASHDEGIREGTNPDLARTRREDEATKLTSSKYWKELVGA